MRRLAVLLEVFTLLFVTGCWDVASIDQREIISGIAIDKAPSGSGVQVTLLAVNTASQGSSAGAGNQGGGEASAGSGKKPFVVTPGIGVTVEKAIEVANASLPRRLSFDHLQLVLVSEDVARESIATVMDFIGRSPEVSKLAYVAVAKGQASKVIASEPCNAPDLPTWFWTFVNTTTSYGQAGTPVWRFWVYLRSTEVILPVIDVDQTGQPYFAGMGFCNEDKLTGTTDIFGTAMLNILRNGRTRLSYTLPDPWEEGTYVTLMLESSRSRVVVQNADPLEIGFIVNISARMTERTGHYRRLTEDDVGDLELAAANGLHESLQGIIRQAQQEWHTDVLRVIPNLRAKKPSVWSQVNWPEEFSQTDIHVDQVSVHITDTGEVR